VSRRAMEAALVLSAVGAVFKIVGGIGYGSRAVFVDALTCIANLGAGLIVYRHLRLSELPPDADHPFGHKRLVLQGLIWMLIIYSFVAGFSAALLYYSAGGYEVESGAYKFALAGTLAYAASVALAARGGFAGASYAGFTFSEVIEGVVTTASAFAGYRYAYIYDLAGGVIILAYLVYELWHEAREIGRLVADVAEREVAEKVRREFERRGLRVKRLRLRMVVPGEYQGDAVVEAGDIPYEVADLLADEAVEEIREKYNVDLVVHIDKGRHG